MVGICVAIGGWAGSGRKGGGIGGFFFLVCFDSPVVAVEAASSSTSGDTLSPTVILYSDVLLFSEGNVRSWRDRQQGLTRSLCFW